MQGLQGPVGPGGKRAFAQAPRGATGGLVLGDADLTLGVWRGMVGGRIGICQCRAWTQVSPRWSGSMARTGLGGAVWAPTLGTCVNLFC